MFVLVADRNSVERAEVLRSMVAELAGGNGPARLWTDTQRNAAVASLPASFVPEDALDAQPIVNSEHVFVCQARVDNREELLEQLGLPAQNADSSLLAAAYDRWGDGCLQKVVGDFAFAAWHRSDGRVVAAVDHHGARRLFWTPLPGGIVVAGQMRPLLAHPSVSREPDLEAMARLFAPGVDRAMTPFLNIKAVPGGHVLVWQAGNVRLDRWWKPESRPPLWYRDARDYADETCELLTRAVAAHLRSSTPVTTTLSGGLDSSAVTAIAARLLAPSPLAAYTSVPEPSLRSSQRSNWDADDGPYAAELAASYPNIDHRLISPGSGCTLDVVPAVHSRSAVPAKVATNLLWLTKVAEMTFDAGSRVLLIAQAGNSAFSWRGEGAIWELARYGRLAAAWDLARAEAKRGDISTARVLASAGRSALRAAAGPSIGALVPRAALPFMRRPIPMGASANEYGERVGSHRLRVAIVTTPKHNWWPDPVAQWGIEVRDPTSDRRLFERLLRYPRSAFRTGGVDRALARAAVEGLVPERVRLRTTQGAQVPEAPSRIALHAGSYHAVLDRMRTSAASRDLFNLDALGHMVDRFAAGDNDYYRAIIVDRAFGVGLFLLEQNA